MRLAARRIRQPTHLGPEDAGRDIKCGRRVVESDQDLFDAASRAWLPPFWSHPPASLASSTSNPNLGATACPPGMMILPAPPSSQAGGWLAPLSWCRPLSTLVHRRRIGRRSQPIPLRGCTLNAPREDLAVGSRCGRRERRVKKKRHESLGVVEEWKVGASICRDTNPSGGSGSRVTQRHAGKIRPAMLSRMRKSGAKKEACRPEKKHLNCFTLIYADSRRKIPQRETFASHVGSAVGVWPRITGSRADLTKCLDAGPARGKNGGGFRRKDGGV